MQIRSFWFCCLIMLTLILGACGSGQPAATTAEQTPESALPTNAAGSSADVPAQLVPAQATGPIHISGSSTVYPLTEAVAQAFMEAGAPTQFSLKSTGTGAGLLAFCQGEEIDIVNASRAITAEEQAACTANGRSPVPFLIGRDALAIVVNRQNMFVESLSFAQLAHIFSGAASTWADVDPSFPREPIALYSPGHASGTFDYFVTAVFAGDTTQMAPHATLSEDDRELVDGVAKHPAAIGYFGFAYYQEHRETLRVVPIDGGDGVIAPSDATVADNTYPLARPLYLYSAPSILQTKPQVATFIAFYLQHATDLITEVGYFPAPSADLATAQANLAAALGTR